MTGMLSGPGYAALLLRSLRRPNPLEPLERLCTISEVVRIWIATSLASTVANSSVLQQIDDTVGVMRENINKVSQRGERLDSLQDKTDNLAVSAQGFRRGANRVRKQMWWKGLSYSVY